ncbi:hypothetical protein GcC1_123014 [Golovinomyces cichoracearum]|uniref:Uncharacterized protein n=1 Tax=Golovinomyces cichoracearum TaxID=62708 RepID=A0A420I6L7_9PEZI|nr:hypothetical protein GcC1_123014 [Golovinomyces cichoracearum]
MAPRPEVLPSLLPSELLTYLLKNQEYPSTLLICQTRDSFIDSLVSDVSLTMQNQTSPKQRNSSSSTTSPRAEGLILDESNTPHSLLLPTLHQIAASRYIDVIFLPTVMHLRVYLATFPPPPKECPMPEKNSTEPGGRLPLLMVYGLIELHHDTSEWCAQGLCNTLASLIEAGPRSHRKVVVTEKWTKIINEDCGSDLNTDFDDLSRSSIWRMRVPILHTTAKYAGVQGENEIWVGRTTEIGRILARWFKFGTAN